MYDTRIKLIRRTDSGRDKYGNIIHAEEKKERWAEVKSVSRAEYYQAATTGMRLTVVIVLSDRRDYEGQSHVVINGVEYVVIRTYVKGETIEITLTEREKNGFFTFISGILIKEQTCTGQQQLDYDPRRACN